MRSEELRCEALNPALLIFSIAKNFFFCIITFISIIANRNRKRDWLSPVR